MKNYDRIDLFPARLRQLKRRQRDAFERAVDAMEQWNNFGDPKAYEDMLKAFREEDTIESAIAFAEGWFDVPEALP